MAGIKRGGLMKHIEGTFKGLRDADIYYQGWLPEGDVKSVLFLIHGLGEHCGRYTNHVNYFVPRGYALYGLDHLGHGRSSGEREVVESFSDYLQPLPAFYRMVKEWQPGKPVFVLGHSMGGLIASTYLVDHSDDFKGGVISAPAIKIRDNISAFTIMVGKILARIAPKAGILPLNPGGISRDPEAVKAYINDPLVYHGKTRAKLAAEILKAMIGLSQNMDKITLPFIVIQGSGDQIVDPGGAQLLYDGAGSKDKTIKVYDGFYHEIHNELERDVMFKDVETWLEAHL
jgi:alpha-beta hydrolase superfamily lysophospholipase